ncbi:MAG: carboxypeptidase-like regulatory domain-containing protein [Butyricicoccus sp.]|nr:carboxypeptidase-like regulatory domain-containing protein [Butyricicoccus sp.]
MPDIQQDLLRLQYSDSFAIQGMQEANIDLELPPASASSATVYGTVTDGTTPIADATVKLFDNAGMPYKHTLTDETGAFSMTGIPAGTYSLGAVKDGYRLSDAAGVTLSSNTTTQINLTCTPDATLSLGAIAGILTAADLEGISKPLAGAKISLRNVTGVEVATTYTADDGEFAFYDVADGVYTLLASADGYRSTSSMTATIVNGSIANLTMSMIVDTRTYNGTVSGIIRNQTGQIVAGCFVGLYRVAQDGSEVLVSVTKTNTAGKYLFGGVTEGQYLVKAKLNQ